MDCLNHIGVARSTEGDVRLHQLRPLPGDLLPMAGAPPSLRVPPFHEHLHRVSELFLIYQSQMLTTFLFGTQPLFRSLHRIQSIHILYSASIGMQFPNNIPWVFCHICWAWVPVPCPKPTSLELLGPKSARHPPCTHSRLLWNPVQIPLPRRHAAHTAFSCWYLYPALF